MLSITNILFIGFHSNKTQNKILKYFITALGFNEKSRVLIFFQNLSLQEKIIYL